MLKKLGWLSVIAMSLTPVGSLHAVTITSEPIELYTSCFNDAISRDDVRKNGVRIAFSCTGDIAKVFFQSLGKYGYDVIEEKRKGATFRVRYTTEKRDDHCAQKVEDANGNATSSYFCYFYFYAGPFLNR